MMLEGPIPATEKMLKQTGLTIADIDVFEINEAFVCCSGLQKPLTRI